MTPVARLLLSPGARRFVSGLSAFAALAAAGARDASAQTPSPLGEWQYTAGVPLQKLFDPNIPTWQVSVGAAMTLQPRYAGSDRYRVMGGPNFDIRYRDLFFLSTGEGLGANVLRGPNWRVSLSVGYDLGRRSADDLGHLNGLDNINAAPVMKLAADYVVSKDFPLVLRADLRRSIAGSSGWTRDFSPYMPMPGDAPRPATEATLTTAPPCSPIHASRARLVQASGASTLTARIFAAAAGSMSSAGP